RAGAKGNTHQQSTYWTQSQVRVSQALARIRQLVPSHTRGRSRMRESRTYGSVRGACDETHVPTATPPRAHHTARWCGSDVAARSARSSRRVVGFRALASLMMPLRDNGYVVGQNVALEYRAAQSNIDLLRRAALELAALPVNVFSPTARLRRGRPVKQRPQFRSS